MDMSPVIDRRKEKIGAPQVTVLANILSAKNETC